MSELHEGGCHCGRVRFRVRVGRHVALDCNCSICRKKGFLHLIVPLDAFDILRGAEALALYEFNTGTAKHRFCRSCGVHPFYTPRSHPDQVDVNVRCLDGDALSEFEVEAFDGANWEQAVDTLPNQ